MYIWLDFCAVSFSVHVILQVQVAIKRLSKERMQNGMQEFLKEAAIMQSVDHENIVRMYGVVLDKENAIMLVSTTLCCVCALRVIVWQDLEAGLCLFWSTVSSVSLDGLYR